MEEVDYLTRKNLILFHAKKLRIHSLLTNLEEEVESLVMLPEGNQIEDWYSDVSNFVKSGRKKLEEVV